MDKHGDTVEESIASMNHIPDGELWIDRDGKIGYVYRSVRGGFRWSFV